MTFFKLHGILDYTVALTLIASPWVFGFENLPFANSVFWASGSALLVYSLMTDYSPSIAHQLPLELHRVFDACLGASLILAPSIYDYRSELTQVQQGLHGAMGLILLSLALFNQRPPDSRSLPLDEELDADLPKFEQAA